MKDRMVSLSIPWSIAREINLFAGRFNISDFEMALFTARIICLSRDVMSEAEFAALSMDLDKVHQEMYSDSVKSKTPHLELVRDESTKEGTETGTSEESS